jgi:hypothetical protein
MKLGKKFRLLVLTAAALLIMQAVETRSQVVVDRTMATVSDGVRTELITLSDLRWQLALEPGKPLDPPTETDLNAALRTMIDQRIFALEAERLPRNDPTKAEIAAAIDEILSVIPPTEFQRRLRLVGFSSVNDERFEELISKRLAIEKYIDFRFRSFVVITRDEEERHYNQVFVPRFLSANSGRVVPAFDQVRPQINSELRELSVEANMESFLDEAKRRVEIVIVNGSL